MSTFNTDSMTAIQNDLRLVVIMTGVTGDCSNAGVINFIGGRCYANDELVANYPRGTKTYRQILGMARHVALEPYCSSISASPNKYGVTIEVWRSALPVTR